MADLAKILVRLLTVLCCAVVFTGDLVEVEARGRGGGRGGRGRSFGRSWGRSRVRRYGGVSSVARHYPYGYRSRLWSWKVAAAAGAIYGFSRYRSRPRYKKHPDREPQICINRYDYKMGNGTHFTLFICPLAHQSDDYTYCCGPEDRQTCCRFWDDGGRVFGVVFGIVLFLLIVGLTIYCCCCRKKPGKPSIAGKIINRQQQPSCAKPGHMVTRTSPDVDLPPQPVDPAVQNQPYPPQSMQYQGPTATYPQHDQPAYPVAPGANDAYPPYPYGGPPGEDTPFKPTPIGGIHEPPYPNAGAPYPFDDTGNPYGVNPPYPPGGNAPYPMGSNSPYPPSDSQSPPPPYQVSRN